MTLESWRVERAGRHIEQLQRIALLNIEVPWPLDWQAPIHAAALGLAARLYRNRSRAQVIVAPRTPSGSDSDPARLERMLASAETIRSTWPSTSHQSLAAEIRSLTDDPRVSAAPPEHHRERLLSFFDAKASTETAEAGIRPFTTGDPPRRAGLSLYLIGEGRSTSPERYEQIVVRELFTAVDLYAPLHGAPYSEG